MNAQKKTAYNIILRNGITVRFNEVDSYNIVHNAHYFNYFDIGRFALVDKFLRRERANEISRYIFLVLAANCKYLHPAQLDDELIVATSFQYRPDQNNARLQLSHSIFTKDHHVPVVEGGTVLGICNQEYKLQFQLPEEVKTYLHDQIVFFLNNPAPHLKIRKVK